MARNLYRMRLRGEARRRAREMEWVTESEADAPESRAGLRELELHLLEALDSLEDSQREAVLLRYAHDMRSAEIARALGVPDATVRWRARRGLDRLRTALSTRTGDAARTWNAALIAPSALASTRAGATLSESTAIQGVIAMKSIKIAAAAVGLAIISVVGYSALKSGSASCSPAAPTEGPPSTSPTNLTSAANSDDEFEFEFSGDLD